MKKFRTVFGVLKHPNNKPEAALLTTPRGERFAARYSRLLAFLRKSGQSIRALDPDFVSRFLSEGRHGKVFTVPPAALSRWERVKSSVGVRLPVSKTLMVKVFRAVPSQHESLAPVDGFSQLVGEMALYNFLKKRSYRFFVARRPRFLFASRQVLVRKFERVPRANDILDFFAKKPLEHDCILPEKELAFFIRQNRIVPEEVEGLVRELRGVVHPLETVKRTALDPERYADNVTIGSSISKGHRPALDPDLRDHNRNILILGRDPKTKKLAVMVYDQPARRIPGVLDVLKNSPPKEKK